MKKGGLLKRGMVFDHFHWGGMASRPHTPTTRALGLYRYVSFAFSISLLELLWAFIFFQWPNICNVLHKIGFISLHETWKNVKRVLCLLKPSVSEWHMIEIESHDLPGVHTSTSILVFYPMEWRRCTPKTMARAAPGCTERRSGSCCHNSGK